MTCSAFKAYHKRTAAYDYRDVVKITSLVVVVGGVVVYVAVYVYVVSVAVKEQGQYQQQQEPEKNNNKNLTSNNNNKNLTSNKNNKNKQQQHVTAGQVHPKSDEETVPITIRCTI